MTQEIKKAKEALSDEAFNKAQDLSGMFTVGVTKREMFAAMAMQGMCANYGHATWSGEDVAALAVDQADELINELNK